MGEKLFGATDEYYAVQFHMHAGSEHTIDGVRHDLEMHTVHYSKDTSNPGDVIAAAVGIMFSVDKYTSDLSWAEQKLVDTFFDGLKWEKLDGTLTDKEGDTSGVDFNSAEATHQWSVDMVTYGDLMQMVDSTNRWVYKGSVTTPPCATYVYWNVLSTIYPISQKHLDLFKA